MELIQRYNNFPDSDHKFNIVKYLAEFSRDRFAELGKQNRQENAVFIPSSANYLFD